jgi:hypothetical protein
MPIFAPDQPRAIRIDFKDEMLEIYLEDGRVIQVPLEWFPSLRDATEAQRANWRLIGRGVGLHWEELDEDLSVRALLLPEFPSASGSTKPVASHSSIGASQNLELGDDESSANGFGKPMTWEESR